MSTIQLDINDDGQLLVDEFDHQGRRMAFTATYPRVDSLRLAVGILGKRIADGTLAPTKTLNALCLEHGVVYREWDQGDRLLTEKYVDNDTGET